MLLLGLAVGFALVAGMLLAGIALGLVALLFGPTAATIVAVVVPGWLAWHACQSHRRRREERAARAAARTAELRAFEAQLRSVTTSAVQRIEEIGRRATRP